MASNASIPARGLPPKPPDKGSFPLDHFGECSDAKKAYMSCLQENTMQTQSEECRLLSAAYLKCRMDRELMAREELAKLGFNKGQQASHTAVLPSEAESHSQEQRRRGFIAGLPSRTPGQPSGG
uniref:CHCH domain-containing protein n=1 Tax=Haptolina brevifila TaxID=156173 RepID=A0A7S2CM11_9EUKA|mmetsp:Transcript_26368/g.52964  ORF Transcript_26368/g.52964 Transcript_26368/m.52964 type:complete len:124 (+) Transcript_26368:114-485(+)